MRENGKGKKPFEIDSKFKMQEEKAKRRILKGRSNTMKHCANATPTHVRCYRQKDITSSHATPHSNRPQGLTRRG